MNILACLCGALLCGLLGLSVVLQEVSAGGPCPRKTGAAAHGLDFLEMVYNDEQAFGSTDDEADGEEMFVGLTAELCPDPDDCVMDGDNDLEALSIDFDVATLPVREEVDVLIGGAGAAGISTGYHLRNTDFSIMIVEASGHIGGRVNHGKLKTVKGQRTVEKGAQWCSGCRLDTSDDDGNIQQGNVLVSVQGDPSCCLLRPCLKSNYMPSPTSCHKGESRPGRFYRIRIPTRQSPRTTRWLHLPVLRRGRNPQHNGRGIRHVFSILKNGHCLYRGRKAPVEMSQYL